MVLDRRRNMVDPLLSWLAQHLQFISANLFSWLALLAAFLAGLFFYLSNPNDIQSFSFLLVASLFVFINGLLDAIDGKIAKLTNTASKQGDFLDHALDRFADVFIVAGLALSPWCDIRLGFFAIIGMLLTSYMGTQAQAVGYQRVYSGLLGRADRLVILMITPVIQFLLVQQQIFFIWQFSLLEWMLILLAVIGNITAVQRFYYTLSWFRKQKKKMKPGQK